MRTPQIHDTITNKTSTIEGILITIKTEIIKKGIII